MKLFSFLLLFFVAKFCYSQHFFVSTHDPFDIAGKKHRGEMILKNGIIITGVFQYANKAFPFNDFKYYSDLGGLIKRIKVETIKRLSLLGSDTSLSNKDSTYFISIKSHLYRQLTFGAVKLFDPTIYVNEKNGLINSEGYFRENVFAIEHRKIITFSAKKDILKFIENKLKEKGINQSFKTLHEAIHYLNYNDM